MTPKWVNIKFAIQRELKSRNLAQPRIRLSALDRLESLLIRTYPGFRSNPAVLLSLDKREVEGALARLKDNGKLNSAERSVLNNVFQVLNGTLGAICDVAEDSGGCADDAAEDPPSTSSDALVDVPDESDVVPKDAQAQLHDATGDASVVSRIRAAREAFKPASVKCLLIGEAPPDALDRFFYYAPVPQHDHLFLGVMEVLFAKAKAEYLTGGRQESDKQALLEGFRDSGFYLLDVSDEPLSLAGGALRDDVAGLLDRVAATASMDTPIILIKKTTFEVAYEPLKQAGYRKLYRKGIPFPGQGWQKEFREGFAEALRTLSVR